MLSIPDVGQIDAFAEPWRRLFAQSPLVSTMVLFGHLGGLFAAGGLTVAADRATLRVDPANDEERRRHMAELARLRPSTWAAFTLAALCGVLLFLADVEAFAASRIFWAKMALVAALVTNALITARLDATLLRAAAAPHADPAAPDATWRRRRAAALVSAALWFALLFVGAALASH